MSYNIGESPIKTKEEARKYAIEWQQWASGVSMSYAELATFTNVFKKLGKRFGLLKEFKENGII